MKRSTFSEEQIMYAIRQAESCAPVGDLCRQRVPAWVALVHDFCSEHRGEGEHIPMGNPFLVGMALNMAKPCKIIQYSPFCARGFGRQSMPFLDESDRRGTVGVPHSCVALEVRYPGNRTVAARIISRNTAIASSSPMRRAETVNCG